MTKTGVMKGAAWVAGLALSAVLASGSEWILSSAAAEGRDACSFLNAKAVSAQVGKPVGEGRKTNEAGGGKSKSHMTTCTWEGKSAPGASPAAVVRDTLGVNLILWSYPTEQRGVQFLESFRKLAKDIGQPAPTPVSIGDEAIVDGTSVHVRKGKSAFTVSVLAFGDTNQAGARKAAEALARQVVTQL